MARQRAPLVVGNWKMNTTVAEGVELAAAVAAAGVPAGVEVGLLPPFPHIWPVHDVIAGTGVMLGAQDCHWEDVGAHTGEVAVPMLVGACELVLVGHSERRAAGETDEQVALKLRAGRRHGLRVVVACGETLEERRRGDAERVVTRQLRAAYAGLDAADAAATVVAYEPVWAIGTGESATAADAEAMCAEIRSVLGSLTGAAVAEVVQVLYGGSVTPTNAAELFAGPDVDGGLVGGASLRAGDFAAIVAAAARRVAALR